MGLSPQLITEELYEKATKRLRSLSQDNRAAIRLRAIVSAKEQGVNLVAKVFGVNSNTIRAWVKAFAKEGLSGLDYRPGRGRKSNLSKEYLEIISKWVQENCNITIAEIVLKLRNLHGVISSKSAVHRALKNMELSYITPRPVHHKQTPEKHTEFKKKSKNNSREHP